MSKTGRSYDEATDSLYIHLADWAAVDSREVRQGVVLDYDGNGALVGIGVQHASPRVDPGGILKIHLANKPIVRETSPNWHTNISYAEDGSAVEIVLLDAIKNTLPS